MYKYNSSYDFRFSNLVATVGTESDGKLVKIYMDTLQQEVIFTNISNPTSVKIDQLNMIVYFLLRNQGGSIYAMPFYFDPILGIKRFQDQKDQTNIGYIYNVSFVDTGNKEILFPDTLTIDGNSNLYALSETEGKIYKFVMTFEKMNELTNNNNNIFKNKNNNTSDDKIPSNNNVSVMSRYKSNKLKVDNNKTFMKYDVGK